MIEGLANVLMQYERGTNAEADRIITEMGWWPMYDIMDVGLPIKSRGKILKLAVALTVPPDYVATCDQLSATGRTDGMHQPGADDANAGHQRHHAAR